MTLFDLKGVGPVTAKKLEKLGITDIESLLYHFPSRYLDRRKNLKVFDLKFIEDENYHCVATIKSLKKIYLRGRREFTTAILEDDTSYIHATWFNNPYIINQYKDGEKVVFSGQINKAKVINPKIKKVLSDEDIKNFACIEAVYPETRGLRSYQIRMFIKEIVEKLRVESDEFRELKETLPIRILKKESLISRKEASVKIHFPNDEKDIEEARKRLGFEEIYKILKQVQKRKKSLKKFNSHQIRINQTAHDLLLETLPFILTDSQTQSIEEILKDIKNDIPMHRLLSGDVGSGKTIVAAAATWQVVNNGLQTIILAPTGVLANQHYMTFKKLFEGYNIPIYLTTSDTKKGLDLIRKEIEESEDHNQIFIGTHALFYHLDLFRKIGLLVIDEQHKFGVKQRELLEQITNYKLQITKEETEVWEAPPLKGERGDVENGESSKSEILNSKEQRTKSKEQRTENREPVNALTREPANLLVPHVLSMSATPIPRSLALTLFGDLDVSFLEKKPEGRKKVITKIINDKDLEHRMYEWIRKEVKENKAQVYVICPLIEESAVLDAKSAIKEFERLKDVYSEFEVELLHGKIKQKEKDSILEKFKNGGIQILVSTSVIEVGIDNPNATIMIIEGAERFGLAQLHQIRGRVGRSDKQSYCFLKTSDGNTNKRLEFFAETDDGFKIAEFDLQHRGPGEVYGEAQSGIPDLKIANILDLELIKRVKACIDTNIGSPAL